MNGEKIEEQMLPELRAPSLDLQRLLLVSREAVRSIDLDAYTARNGSDSHHLMQGSPRVACWPLVTYGPLLPKQHAAAPSCAASSHPQQ